MSINKYPLKIINGGKVVSGNTLYLTNAANGVAYLYQEDNSCHEPEMDKVGFIPASANPPLNQRELPMKVILVRIPISDLKAPLDSPIKPTLNYRGELWVTTEGAETKEQRAKRLYGVKDTVLYKGVTYDRAAIPAHLRQEIIYAEMQIAGPAVPKLPDSMTAPYKTVMNTKNFIKSPEGLLQNVDTTKTKQKEQTMIAKMLEVNKNAATQAAQLELGRVANSTLEGILQKRFPNIPNTPFNALVIANLASVIGKQVKPAPKLDKLTDAMVISAYGEVFQMLNLDEIIKELLDAVGDKITTD